MFYEIFYILLGILLGVCIFLLYKHIEEYTYMDDPKLQEIKTLLLPMFKDELICDNSKYNDINCILKNRNILNEISIYRGNKSYTINKNQIFICLKNEKGQYYDNNTLIYVTLHEIAHTLCDEVGHTDKFSDLFEQLLIKAQKLQIYDPSKKIEPNYCPGNGDTSF
jgi:hypothetical protein